MTALESTRKMQKIILDINEILIEYGINFNLTLEDVTITENGIYVLSSSKFYGIVEEYVYPSISEAYVYHFTTKEASKNIEKTEKFRMYSILKRYGEGEIKPLLKKLNFNMLFDDTDNLKDKNSYKHTFYASFISADETGQQSDTEKYFRSLTDVRLKFKIKSTKGYFRKINYMSNNKIEFLEKLHNLIKEKYNRVLMLDGILSRFPTFTISDEYSIEDEYRIYWKVFDNGYNPFKIKIDEDNNEYIELSLDKNNFTGITLSLKEIEKC